MTRLGCSEPLIGLEGSCLPTWFCDFSDELFGSHDNNSLKLHFRCCWIRIAISMTVLVVERVGEMTMISHWRGQLPFRLSSYQTSYAALFGNMNIHIHFNINMIFIERIVPFVLLRASPKSAANSCRFLTSCSKTCGPLLIVQCLFASSSLQWRYGLIVSTFFFFFTWFYFKTFETCAACSTWALKCWAPWWGSFRIPKLGKFGSPFIVGKQSLWRTMRWSNSTDHHIS
jgi:hypothetical protein